MLDSSTVIARRGPLARRSIQHQELGYRGGTPMNVKTEKGRKKNCTLRGFWIMKMTFCIDPSHFTTCDAHRSPGRASSVSSCKWPVTGGERRPSRVYPQQPCQHTEYSMEHISESGSPPVSLHLLLTFHLLYHFFLYCSPTWLFYQTAQACLGAAVTK